MFYTYILLSVKTYIFYIDSSRELEQGILLHNQGRCLATRPHTPWEIVWYQGFETEKEAKDFATYLKSRRGSDYAYKRFVS